MKKSILILTAAAFAFSPFVVSAADVRGAELLTHPALATPGSPASAASAPAAKHHSKKHHAKHHKKHAKKHHKKHHSKKS